MTKMHAIEHNRTDTVAPGGSIIDMQNVVKTYETTSGAFTALDGVDMKVAAGEYLAIIGKSGSGKSTMINMITGIDRSTSGSIVVGGVRIADLNESGLATWRGLNVGVVFQFFQLLPTLTVVENVMLPMEFCNTYPSRERRLRALDLLDRVGIAEQANKLPATLSGGQQQRVAIARALANEPAILVADEPTGNLDSRTSDAVLRQFSDLADTGTTVIMVTHERDVANVVDRTITLADGKVEADVAVLRQPAKAGGPK